MQRARARRSLELELRQAIIDGGLEIYYQPVVNIEDGKIIVAARRCCGGGIPNAA